MTDPASVAAAAAATRDAAILINNAGSGTEASLLTGDLADVRLISKQVLAGLSGGVRGLYPQVA